MSHDQRPGRMRVVQDAAAPKVRTTIEGTAQVVPPSALATAPAKAGLPLAQAILFLLACIGGGVVIAVLRPFGLG